MIGNPHQLILLICTKNKIHSLLSLIFSSPIPIPFLKMLKDNELDYKSDDGEVMLKGI